MSEQRRQVIVLESHDDLYYYWKENRVEGVELVHVDPHCDLYGALINEDGTMCQVREDPVHEGNFFIAAIKEGMVRRVDWVFDEYGNRRYDDTAVLFESDAMMKLPWVRARHRKLERFPFGYRRVEFDQWEGMAAGEHLSLDWDFFAFVFKNKKQIDAETEAFLQREWAVVPPVTYVCYSHPFVHPSALKFAAFCERLAERFDAELVTYERRRGESYPGAEVDDDGGGGSRFWRLCGAVKRIPRRVLHKLGYHC